MSYKNGATQEALGNIATIDNTLTEEERKLLATYRTADKETRRRTVDLLRSSPAYSKELDA